MSVVENNVLRKWQGWMVKKYAELITRYSQVDTVYDSNTLLLQYLCKVKSRGSWQCQEVNPCRLDVITPNTDYITVPICKERPRRVNGCEIRSLSGLHMHMIKNTSPLASHHSFHWRLNCDFTVPKIYRHYTRYLTLYSSS